MYAYKVFNKFRIYRPLETNKLYKWKGNLSNYDIQGWEQLPKDNELLIITKSLKDVMVLKTFGYYAIAPSCETANIPDKIIKEITKHFQRIIVLYDYDDTGTNGAKRLKEKYNFEIVFIPLDYYKLYNTKDISDYRKEFGEKKTKELLKEMIK
jgi:5S rRNA maturation endonuclease (ribonuclease M5)